MRDILICCIDGLKGFPDAIRSVFPESSVQLCVVHQIRNSVKYVGSKHQKDFIKDLRTVHGAVNKDSAAANLDLLDAKWGEIYPIVIKSWRDNWEHLTEYFQYTLPSANSSIRPTRLRAIIDKSEKSPGRKAFSLQIHLWRNLCIWLIAISVKNGLCNCELGTNISTVGYKIWR